MPLFTRFAFVVSSVLLAPALIWAQSQNSGISGRVTDPSGATVPGAELTLTSLARQTTAKARLGPMACTRFLILSRAHMN